VHPVNLPAAAAPKLPREFEHMPSTEPRFGFDAFCKVQLLLVHEPVASGFIMWFGRYPEESIELDVVNPIKMLPDFSSYGASGALAVDAGLLFTTARGRLWSTPLRPAWHTVWLDIARHHFRKNWVSFDEIVTFTPASELATIAPIEPAWTPLPNPSLSAEIPALVDIATPYSEILSDLIKVGPWRSRKKLSRILGTSHTQIGRILKDVAVPSDEVAPRIDELHRFHQRLSRLTRADATATKRLLTTPRERDGLSANDFLERQDYRNAFRAVMEAASPRPEVAAVESVPRRWYDEPSRDLYDDEIPPDD